MSSSIVHAPLNALRSVQQVMHTQFPNLDVPALYRMVDRGLRRKSPDDDDNDTDEKQAFDDSADAAFSRSVEPDLQDFAVLLEAVAPTLVRFSHMTESTRAYLKAQVRQAQYLRNILIMSYVLIVIILVMFVFKAWMNRPLRQAFILVVILVIAFYTVHALMFSMEIMLRRRINSLKAVDISMLDRLDVSLGKNVFVRFAEAYARGDQKSFVKTFAQDRLSTEDDDTDDIIFDFCSADPSSPGAVATRECIISPCVNWDDIEGMLLKYVRQAWERRRDVVVDCDRMMLALLHTLAEIHTGSVFESNDPYSMWRGIQHGVDDVRNHVLRNLDVTDMRRRYSAEEKLRVIRDEIAPLLRLDVTECTDLKPVNDVYEDKDAFDASVRTKEDCWRMAVDDPDCTWAYFEPCRGAIFATDACDDQGRSRSAPPLPNPMSNSRVNRACVSTKNPEKFCLSYAPRESSINSKGTLLVKNVDGHRDKELFVEGVLGGTDLPSDWVPNRAVTVTSKRDCLEEGEQCAVLDLGRTANCADPGNESAQEPRIRVFRGPPDGVAYTDVFDVERQVDREVDGCAGHLERPNSERVFHVKTTIGKIATLNLSTHSYSTLYSRSEDIVNQLVNVLKVHHHAVSLESYHDFLHDDLGRYYGNDRYTSLIRDLVNDLLRKTEIRMSEMVSDPSRDDRTKFVNVTRFEERIRKLTFTETRTLVRKLGGLAKVTKLYSNKLAASEQSSPDRAISNVFLLWSAALVLIMLFSLVLYNTYYIDRDSEAGYIFRNIAMSVCLFVFSLVVLGTMVARHLSNKRFNEQISDDNGKRLVSSTVRSMDVAAQHLEHMALQRAKHAKGLDENTLRREFVDLYRGIGNTARAKALERGAPSCEGDHEDDDQDHPSFRTGLAQEPANLQELYFHMRTAVKTYDSCNTITIPDDPPFPAFDITMYAITAFLALAMLFYAYSNIDPIARVRNINKLTEARKNIRAGMPNPSDLSQLIKCLDVKKDTWASVMNTIVVMMVILIFMITYFIARSSANYENSLYMSGLYTEGRCKPS